MTMKAGLAVVAASLSLIAHDFKKADIVVNLYESSPTQPVRLHSSFLSSGDRIPDPGGNEMAQFDRIRRAQAASPSVECTCDRQDRSTPTRRVGTSGAAPLTQLI